MGFEDPDGTEHCIMVLVDDRLGPIAKDVALLPKPLVEMLGVRGGMDLAEANLAEAAERILAAMAMTEISAGAPSTSIALMPAALLKACLGTIATRPV